MSTPKKKKRAPWPEDDTAPHVPLRDDVNVPRPCPEPAEYCDGRLVAEPLFCAGLPPSSLSFYARRWWLDGEHVNPPVVAEFLTTWPGGLKLTEAWLQLRTTDRCIEAAPDRPRTECCRCREVIAAMLAEDPADYGQLAIAV